MRFNNLKIRNKIILGFGLVIVLLFLFGFFYLSPKIIRTNQDLIESRTRQVVDVGYGIIDHYYKDYKQGIYKEDEAKRFAIEALRTIRYGGQEYFWVNDYHPNMIMHPKTELEGTDLSNYADPDGKKLFAEMVKVVNQNNEGFVYYKWEKPGKTDPQPKVSFVKGFKEWNWIIGSGVYIDDIKTVQNRINFSMIFFLLVSSGIIVLIAIFISRRVTKGINKGLEIARVISNGDLTTNIDQELLAQEDEVGKIANALQNMVERLREIIGNVISGSDAIAEASLQISSGSQQLSEGASEQASNTEEVSSSMEQMSANIQQNTDNAQQAEKISQNVSQGIQKVGSAAKESLDSIRNIAAKISIINDIAFQTNILALNAAVEAARAGESGRGFAVVAAEVRKLAERSKIAADDIVALAAKSVHVTESASELMGSLIPEIEKTSKLVQEISAASIEQSTGSDQINSATQQLNQVTQQNAASSEELASSSEELSSQAQQLKEIISFFKIDNDSKSTTAYTKKRKDLLSPESTSEQKKINPRITAKHNQRGVTLKMHSEESGYENF